MQPLNRTGYILQREKDNNITNLFAKQWLYVKSQKCVSASHWASPSSSTLLNLIQINSEVQQLICHISFGNPFVSNLFTSDIEHNVSLEGRKIRQNKIWFTVHQSQMYQCVIVHSQVLTCTKRLTCKNAKILQTLRLKVFKLCLRQLHLICLSS